MLETMGREEMFLRLVLSPAGRKDGVAWGGGSAWYRLSRQHQAAAGESAGNLWGAW